MKKKPEFHGSDLEKIADYYHLDRKKIVLFGANVNPLGLSGQVKKDLAEHLDIISSYPDRDYTDLKKAIAAYTNTSPEHIVVGNGSTELISLLISQRAPKRALLLGPTYSEYARELNLVGGTLEYYNLKEEQDFRLDISDLTDTLKSDIDLLIICNPNNPTGVLYPKELLLEIIQIARESGLLIFADEIYDRLVMDGKQHISLASLTEDVPVITLNGLSKSHCLCGYRSGWMGISGPRELTEDYRQGIIQLTSLRLCANTMAQIVIPAALDDMETPASMIRPGGRIYEQREATVRELEKINGLSFVKNDAAFYVFPKLDVKKFNITNDKQFAHDLLDATNILLVPGSGFDWKDPDHFRIVMLPQADVLSDAIRRMGTFLDGYKQK